MAQHESGVGEGAGGDATRGVIVILLAGLVLGLGYNYLGLSSNPEWGLSWIAEDRLEELEKLPSVGNGVNPKTPIYTDVSDPLAVPAATGLPAIPAVGRPVQIELGAFKQYVDAGAALVIDAREAWEYEEAHIPGAINMPYDEVVTDPARLESLDTGGRPIVTYCGGGGCEVSLGLADELIYAGHARIAVFTGGLPQWIEAGYPTTDSAEEQRP